MFRLSVMRFAPSTIEFACKERSIQPREVIVPLFLGTVSSVRFCPQPSSDKRIMVRLPARLLPSVVETPVVAVAAREQPSGRGVRRPGPIRRRFRLT